MKWEFSSMFTVSLMLILIPFTSEFEDLIFRNLWFNLFPGLTFFVVGLIGGLLTENEYAKAILMTAASYLVIGLFTLLSISIHCNEWECFYIGLLFAGIPIGILLTSFGMILGYQIRVHLLPIDDDN